MPLANSEMSHHVTPAEPLGWRTAIVYGLGLSGRAAAELLLSRGVGVVGVDDRSRQDLDLGRLAEAGGLRVIHGGDGDRDSGCDRTQAILEGIDAVIVSPGVPLDRPLIVEARRRGLEILAEVELAYRLLDAQSDGEVEIVGITGSNGKSTTTALVGAMLAQAGRSVEVCGNIGQPLAGRVDGPMDRIFVVELSSFQLETVDRFRPQAAALLNVAPDHLDRHGGLAAYTAAKRRVFERQVASDTSVLNADDEASAATPVVGRRREFSRRKRVVDGCYLDGDRVIEVDLGSTPESEDLTPSILFERSDLTLPGVHNLENAMAAALLARGMGVDSESIRAALRTFTGLPHRLELVASAGGVSWFDDSKGTNPAATLGSLAGFEDGTVHLILGGRNKGSDFSCLREVVATKARRIYLIGEAAGELETTLADTAPIEITETLDRAVAAAAVEARPGEFVVLSPACASFDQFRDFNQRGEVFHRLVRAMVPAGRSENGTTDSGGAHG